MKAILLIAAVAAAAAVPQYDPHTRPEEYDPYDPPKYEFEYSVKDHASVNDYGQREARDGPSTAGSYEVRLPDTRLQRVVYSVDGDSGFIADVEFDGQAQHPDEYSTGSSAGGRSYAAPVQSHGSTRSQSHPEPPRTYASPAPKTSYGSAPSQPKTSYRPAPTPRTSYGPAPSQPKTSYRPAPTPKTSYEPASNPPKASYRPAPSPPKASYRPAPSPPKASYRPAPSPPKASYRPAPSPPKASYRPAPSPPKASYGPAPSQPKSSYSPAAEPASAPEPSVYGSKKLKFASVPSDVYDKPLFRADYERAVQSRGGSGRKRKEKVAPARYGPSAVLIGSDDDKYIVPDTPLVPGLQKLLSAPWVSYQKAVDAYLAKEDKAAGDDAGKVTYAGGREESHGASEEVSVSSDGSAVPYGARISPETSSGGDDYPSYKTIQ